MRRSGIARTEENSRIKLLFLIDYITVAEGGTEQQLIKLVNSLDRDRYEVRLTSLGNTDWLKGDHGIKCPVDIMGYNPGNHGDPGNLISLFKLARSIKDYRPHIIMNYFKTCYIVGPVLSRLVGVPITFSTRRDYGQWYDKNAVRLVRISNRFVDRIITNSSMVKDLTSRVEGFDPSRISVIHNCMDIASLMPSVDETAKLRREIGIPDGSMVVGNVANLRPMKHHETMLKAARRIYEQRGDDIHFLLVGDGPLREDLERMCGQLGISDVVRFAGRQADVLPWLKLFNVAVNSSANEGFSNAIMEYMAYGIPVVASDAGGNPELIHDHVNGLLFPLYDDRALTRLLLKLLDDALLRERFTEVSQERAHREFTVEKMMQSYDDLFNDALTDAGIKH